MHRVSLIEEASERAENISCAIERIKAETLHSQAYQYHDINRTRRLKKNPKKNPTDILLSQDITAFNRSTSPTL